MVEILPIPFAADTFPENLPTFHPISLANQSLPFPHFNKQSWWQACETEQYINKDIKYLYLLQYS